MDKLAPDSSNYTRGGAVVLFQKSGTSGYLDLGNIPDFGFSTGSNFLEHKSARDGTLVLDRREAIEKSLSFKSAIDEFNAANLALLLGGTDPAAFSQASATDGELEVATPTLNRWYSLGAYRVTEVVVKVGVTTKTAGTDYTVDAQRGLVRFLSSGTILASDTVEVTFSQPAIAGDLITPLSASGLVRGAARIYFKTSDGRLWVWTPHIVELTFEGEATFTGEQYAKISNQLLVVPDYSQAKPYGEMTVLPAA